MTRTTRNNLTMSLNLLPRHAVVTLNWLNQHHVGPKLAYWYVKNGLLLKLGKEAFIRNGDYPSWAGVLNALQKQLDLKVHVGGLTALQLQGLSHYVPLGKDLNVNLYINPNSRLPAWLKNVDPCDGNFVVHKNKIFEPHTYALVDLKYEGVEVTASSPERAILEVLYAVKTRPEYEAAYQLCENLNLLRPTYLQTLLANCTSIKAKRLLLYFGEEQQHPWVAKIDTSKLDLGSGKRRIAGGGKYSRKFDLLVPNLESEAEEYIKATGDF